MGMYVAGIDIGGTNLKFGIFNERGIRLYMRVLRSVPGQPEATAQQIAELIKNAPIRVSMVGIGVPGTVFKPSGEVFSGNLKWPGVKFGKLLEEKIGLPVWMDNDAQAALAAETLPGGSCFGLDTAVYLTLGTGIGGALLIGGRPWRGHDNGAGELGHFVTHAGGLQCACGMKGCFEMYASAGALARLSGGVRARSVIDRVRNGDEKMHEALRAYATEVAIGICSLYMIFRPQAVVLGGGVSAAGDTLGNEILAAIPDAYNFSKEEVQKALRFATRGNDAGMAGAAKLALLNLKKENE
ncbi:MAG: ROK family protein [Clostridia bacterium]|nr:ROK family protein [Clostridia bacterium]MBQ5771439.1 ROK family protein [Clostridia bacterium]